MSDAFGDFQDTRRVSGEQLEVLGQEAARQFHAGAAPSLSDAVVAIVKDAALTPEQVRRVVEHTNTHAFLREFRKEGAGDDGHRVVDFGSGGPADPQAVLGILNAVPSAGQDSGLSDYATLPDEKVAGAPEFELVLEEAFGAREVPLPFESPLGDALDLQAKLASAIDHLASEIEGLELVYADLQRRLDGHVKQAVLGGTPLGYIADAWTAASPHASMPLAHVASHLVDEGVFRDMGAARNSLEKRASGRLLNRDHPLVTDFAELSDAREKLAHRRAACDDLTRAHADITAFIKDAALAGDMYRAAAHSSHNLANAVSPVVGRTLGSGAEWGSRKILQNAHNIGLALAANEGYTHLQHSPSPGARAARRVGNVVLRNIPGTTQHVQHQWEVQNGQ